MNSYTQGQREAFNAGNLSIEKKLENFPRYADRRDVATFLNRYEIFKLALNTHGSIIECGVNLGAGLFSWLHFSSILEPYNSSRKIIGFDTFSGFQSLDKKDETGIYPDEARFEQFVQNQCLESLIKSVEYHDSRRTLGEIQKVEIVDGDATKTIPKYIENNPHLLISLLHLDFDIYAPSVAALEYFYPRMSKGAVIAFDGLDNKDGPGETTALLETVGIKNYTLRRNVFDSFLTYLIIE